MVAKRASRLALAHGPVPRRTVAWMCAAWVGLVAAPAWCLASKPLSLDEIRNKLRANRARIQSLFVEYEHEDVPLVNPRILFEWDSLYFVLTERVQEAFKGEKRFEKTILPVDVEAISAYGYVNPQAPPSIQRNQKQLGDQHALLVARGIVPPGPAVMKHNNVIVSHNGDYTWTYASNDGTYLRWAKDQPSFSLRQNYLRRVGLCLPDPLSKEPMKVLQRRRNSLPEAFELGSYRVLGDAEKVDGSRCIVVEGEYRQLIWDKETVIRDRIWLDEQHGLALRQRELSFDGRPQLRFVNTDLVEVLPGLWLPRASEAVDIAPPWDPRDFGDKPVFVRRLKVLDLRVNQVANDQFEVPPGVKLEEASAPRR